MADRPILFSAPMVRALIREAREPGTGKSMHREIVRLFPSVDGRRFSVYPPEELIELEPGEFARGICHYASTGALSGPYKLPSAVGGRLVVRETMQVRGCGLIYLADEASVPGGSLAWQDWLYVYGERPIPPKDMLRRYSRLTLIVTEVRVERLNEISEADAQAEGVEPTTCANVVYGGEGFPSYRSGFGILWNGLHGPNAWQANPWVSVTRFRPVLANIDALAQAEPSQGREAVR